MSEEGTGSQAAAGDLLPGLNLKSAANSIAEARARLELRQSVGRALRGAIKHILEAQEKLEGGGTIPEFRLDLLEAIRFIGAVESSFKGSEPEATPERSSGAVVSPRESSSDVTLRLDASPAEPPGEVDPPPRRNDAAILEPGSPLDRRPRRQSLSVLGAVPPVDQGNTPDSSARRVVPQTNEAAPDRAAVSEADTRAHQDAAGGAADSLNRRCFDRLAAAYSIQLQAPYDGFSNSDLTQLPISGITLNLSRGGMLAQIEQGALRHGRYLIRFLGAGQNVRPEIVWGRVRRSRTAAAGWEVGIEFDSPLEILRR